MNRLLKKILSVIIIFVIIGMVIPKDAVAAPKKTKLTVSFKGKSVSLMTAKYNKDTLTGTATVARIKKAWGKPNKKSKNGNLTFYTYKKGKTSISFYGYNNKKKDKAGRYIGGFEIEINDKNAKVCGVKVGMTEEKAMSILKKKFGESKLYKPDDVDMICAGIGQYLPVQYDIKDGKVSRIYFWCS